MPLGSPGLARAALGRSWAALGPLGPLLSALGPLLAALGALLGGSWPRDWQDGRPAGRNLGLA